MSEEIDDPEHDSEYDAPKEIPREMTEEVRNMVPSFKKVDVQKYFDLVNYKPYGKQWLFHKSKARFKVASAGRRAGKTSMSGKSVQPLLLVPNKRIWAVGPSYTLGEKEFRVVWDDLIVRLGFGKDKRVKKAYCVDTETSIFTQRGWLHYNEVKIGDKTLSINTKTGFSEWDELKSIHIFEGTHDVIKMEGATFSSVSTPEHRWLTNRRKKSKYVIPGWTWRTTKTLTQLDRIPKSALCANLPIEAKYSDEFVELVGWIWTEGNINGKSFQITQSHKVNLPYVNRIRKALEKICSEPIKGNRWYPSEYWSERKIINGITKFDLGVEISKEFWKVFKSHKVVDPKFILSLTESQLRLFLDASVCADGSHTSGAYTGNTNIVQNNLEQLFAAHMACNLLGIPTSIISNSDFYVLTFLKNNWNNPKIAAYDAENRYSGGMTITNNIIEGIVWCPTTNNGNWLAKRNGKVYYTGNSVKQGNMFIELPWNTRFEVRSAERADYLVGDSLDHVIMSEAAKHNSETWFRYIQPALSDKRGTADFLSTPEGMNWYHKIWQWGQNPEYVDFESWQYPSWSNPYVYPGGRQDPEILLMEKTMPRDEFLQEIAADFTSFSGKIYDEFEETVHVRKCTYNPAWKNYIAFDFGFVNPLAAIEFQVDPMDRVHVWREHYKDRIILEQHLEILRSREQPVGYKIDLCFGDAADPGAIATISSQFAPCWGDPKSKDNWMEGIQLVKSFLKPQQVGEIDEYGTPLMEPWLFIDHSCENTIREFNNYRSAPKARSSMERNLREEAKKHDDHALDALRYGMMHIFKLGANVSLSSVIDLSSLKKVDQGGFFKVNGDMFKSSGGGLFDGNKRFS